MFKPWVAAFMLLPGVNDAYEIDEKPLPILTLSLTEIDHLQKFLVNNTDDIDADEFDALGEKLSEYLAKFRSNTVKE